MQTERLRLEAYGPRHRSRWNAFVAASKNGAFLFNRDFMEYHADRFVDGSLLAFEGDDESNLVALLPANRTPGMLVSHGGLTYGGWVVDARMTASAMLRLFELCRERLRAEGVGTWRYKVVPRCYHRQPAEEDLHALFVNGAQPIRMDLGSVIELASAPAWSKGRRHALSKARAAGATVERTEDYQGFIACLTSVLARHGAAPVHTAAELELLAGRFPDGLALWRASAEGRALAYILIFDCGQTVHTQYMANSDEGRTLGGLEAILHHLQHDAYADRRFLSFGTSMEADGRTFNPGLVAQKEMFGARAMVSPIYDIAAG